MVWGWSAQAKAPEELKMNPALNKYLDILRHVLSLSALGAALVAVRYRQSSLCIPHGQDTIQLQSSRTCICLKCLRGRFSAWLSPSCSSCNLAMHSVVRPSGILQEFLGGGDKAGSLVHQFQAKQATMKGPEGASLKPYYKGEGDLDDLGYGSAVASSSHAGPSQAPAAPSRKATRAPQQQIVDMRAEPAIKQQAGLLQPEISLDFAVACPRLMAWCLLLSVDAKGASNKHLAAQPFISGWHRSQSRLHISIHGLFLSQFSYARKPRT